MYNYHNKEWTHVEFFGVHREVWHNWKGKAFKWNETYILEGLFRVCSLVSVLECFLLSFLSYILTHGKHMGFLNETNNNSSYIGKQRLFVSGS